MSKTMDPTISAFAALARARHLPGQALGELAWRRAIKTEEEACTGFLETVPVTVRGAMLHACAALRERAPMEEHAAEGAREYRRQASGRWIAAWEHAVPADVADLDTAPSAARKIRGGARLLARRRQGALPLLRQALEIVRAFPLPETDNEAIERHLDLALAFLARPRAV